MRVLIGARLETTIVQRRRKAKSKPRDVFSNAGQNQKKAPLKKDVPPPKHPKKPATKKPPSKPIPTLDSVTSVQKEDVTQQDELNSETNQTEDITESQILGETRKSIGLRTKDQPPEPESKETGTSKRAQDIIDKSRARAMESLVKKVVKSEEVTTPIPVVPKKKSRKTKTSFQPAERKRRLDRSRHMEYKYEVRKLLVDLNIEEEHRSSILGTVWAKGERQTVSDAKEYLISKNSEGVIDDAQLEALTRIVDSYTIRR